MKTLQFKLILVVSHQPDIMPLSKAEMQKLLRMCKRVDAQTVSIRNPVYTDIDISIYKPGANTGYSTDKILIADFWDRLASLRRGPDLIATTMKLPRPDQISSTTQDSFLLKLREEGERERLLQLGYEQCAAVPTFMIERRKGGINADVKREINLFRPVYRAELCADGRGGIYIYLSIYISF